MLDHARVRPDVDWVLGDLHSFTSPDPFDLVVMTGHVFQVFLGDDEIRDTLAAIVALLAADGRLAFETRNPGAKAWESWDADHAVEVAAPTGGTVRVAHDVQQPLVDGVVRFRTTFVGPAWDGPAESRSSLRFVDREELAAFLDEAGLSVESQFGDWAGGRLTDSSPEIVTVARRRNRH